ncbi:MULTISPECIES: hypothetical protein [unclassified Mesorhizobium]|uniref:hypothetical protein n=1 Tax=unclassified Mesorhizobium TaxID=325217 RepID=UPI000FD878A0|nr:MULTISPECIES: hypothetical protein [unclassified Mesorhizobium]TGR17944.1 hypothetical protein EN840_33145 [Mesorhizobium sp. M8A.F.Ca.ET.197.01.1.1]TGR36588.1 hypothetical protein EN842_53965 [bacterium M00.F.Ca.ET.199.01.1.1]TGR40135.1 hypothetical protein EN841_33140 [Mesorhizobium sp. M8A.F.Ca.ET.198.01.1.1]TGV81626.1 hypothetical protein EN792_033765 [Mesorhizobium sp. M00.F.Ca.ET.149.01.1.1]
MKALVRTTDALGVREGYLIPRPLAGQVLVKVMAFCLGRPELDGDYTGGDEPALSEAALPAGSSRWGKTFPHGALAISVLGSFKERCGQALQCCGIYIRKIS